MIETFKTKSDKDLKDLIAAIEAILHDRDQQRKKQTMAKIQDLAGQVGLQVSVKPPRKRKHRKHKIQESKS